MMIDLRIAATSCTICAPGRGRGASKAMPLPVVEMVPDKFDKMADDPAVPLDDIGDEELAEPQSPRK